ncbi:MAG: ABC transporter ATP-binding protein [Chloroflexi bacterium]|nr:ABC transporter ATP-binding protein [Chloroflexota bacterium]MBV9132885.1 ABC transporter ATP-binding protein [Chloroflexota bacterium]MBV9899036.1 ABC transporter ATP-binding protein [Chloroflexota bacterium]
MLIVDGIHTYYGDSHVLQGVSLEVRAGELVALLGRNGAGKTTTLSSIIGFLRPRAGSVTVLGRDMTGKPPHAIAGAGVGLVPQGRRIFAPLSVRENLVFAARPSGPWTLSRVYELFPRLMERQHLRGTSLSGGEQQMLAIGRALLMNPSVLLMDEPSEGLAPLIVRDIGRIIGELKQSGMAILLAEQNLAMALSVADRCYVLNKGQVVAETSASSLRADEDLKHRFLGV